MFDPEKRQTLRALLFALSSTVVRPEGLLQPEMWQPLLSSKPATVKVNEATIQGFEKLIQACWQFSKGNELALAEKLLPECMIKLVPLAQQPSPHQSAAMHLAAQGYKLYSILALHRNDLSASELYARHAVQYSILAGNKNLLLTATKGLGDRFYYRVQYVQALHIYLDALPHLKGASLLLQAKAHMSLAVAYAHVDQSQESLRYLGLALDVFPDDPESDPYFAYAEFDLSQMILWEGIVRSQLDQTKRALDIFKRAEQSHLIIPERIRVEIINQRAKTAIVSGDLEQGSAYVEAGVTGAKALGSQRRYNEAYDNFKQMCMLWPEEKRVKELKEIFAL